MLGFGIVLRKDQQLEIRRLCCAPKLALSNYVQEILIKPTNETGLRTVLRINFCCA